MLSQIQPTRKVHTIETIRELLATNDEAVKRALIALTARQTSEERFAEKTIENNGRGWNGADAELMTSFTKQLSHRGWLSAKQIRIARRRLPKYAGQLLKVIAEKATVHQ